jgi:L-fuculose-phosphate aldolase
MEDCGMTVGTWGNISVRVDDNHFLITPSGMKYSTLAEQDMVLLDMTGKIVNGIRKPSIENGLHRMIYRARSDVQSIVHTHPKFSTAFAIARKEIPAVTEELIQIIGEGVKCARYALPGTEELANNTVDALGDRNAALLANHGAVCVGASMDSAFLVAEVLEKAAQAIIFATIVGTPFVISHEECIAMREFVNHSYGQR